MQGLRQATSPFSHIKFIANAPTAAGDLASNRCIEALKSTVLCGFGENIMTATATEEKTNIMKHLHSMHGIRPPNNAVARTHWQKEGTARKPPPAELTGAKAAASNSRTSMRFASIEPAPVVQMQSECFMAIAPCQVDMFRVCGEILSLTPTVPFALNCRVKRHGTTSFGKYSQTLASE